MKWTVRYLDDALNDIKNLDGSQRKLVLKAIDKVSQNPVSIFDGGYGKPLGNKSSNDLSGLFKIKLRNAGIRIVYKLVSTENGMTIIVVGARSDNEAYGEAYKRKRKYDL